MQPTDRLQERISRATMRLARLQAHELLAAQRKATRERDLARRAHAKLRQRVGELVIRAGAADMPDAELVGALVAYLRDRRDPPLRLRAREIGEAHLRAPPPPPHVLH